MSDGFLRPRPSHGGAPGEHGEHTAGAGPCEAPGAGTDGVQPAVCGAAPVDQGGDRAAFVRFTVPGNPVGKGRPRVATRGRFAQLYTPEKTASYESLVKLSGHRAMEGRPLILDAVAVTLEILVPIPASWSQKKQAQALAGRIHPTTKPDIDNVEKAIFDGLNGIAWKDDVQVVRVTKAKRYSASPCVQVSISLVAH